MRKKYIYISGVFIAIFIVSIFVIPLLCDKYKEISCTYYDIDVISCEVRKTKYIVFMEFEGESKETLFSKLVKELYGKQEDEKWERESVKTMHSSIHYKYAGVSTMLDTIAKYFVVNNVPKETQECYIRDLLFLLRNFEINKFKEKYNLIINEN